MRFTPLRAQIIGITAAALLLAGCTSESDSITEQMSVTPTTSAAPEFQPQEVDTVVAENPADTVHDPGLNVDFTIQKAAYNNEGPGSVVYVLVHNLNEVPLPTDAFSASLTAGGIEGNPMDAGTIALDLPLGAGASTNLQFAFDVSSGNLWDATFRIGNVEFNGNLNNVQTTRSSRNW